MKNNQKAASSIGIIGGADGPTSVFLAGRRKRTIKQRFRQAIYRYKRKRAARSIKAGTHTMEQVREYVKEKWDYTEMSKDNPEYRTDYSELRASFVMQYAPQLLGELAELPKLQEHTEEALRAFMEQVEQKQKAAEAVPKEDFDIDLCILVKEDSDCQVKILLESKYGYIGASASGDKKQMKKFREMNREVYLYYGVEQSDMDTQSRRYKALVGVLAE